MRLLLTSKDCVRFGLVKGCMCVLKDIVFADAEHIPDVTVAGEVIQLKFSGCIDSSGLYGQIHLL